ncbi:type II toxin-antitoxin system VapC family toxin [Picosynechococcus sp. PCC 7117]|uniref:type II toxin-antitoxin system VapC family toxin n=2 Tax=Picosynechococcus sp. PCC 7117 TaxID=195498 RepID=UPI000ABE3C2D
MMTAILDTSFLFALSDRDDLNHRRVLSVAQNTSGKLVLPVAVVPEICYLLASRLGHRAMRQFISRIHPEAVQLEATTIEDCKRISELLEIYADNQLDFTDTAIVAIAERLEIETIYTLDRRDFSVICPRHCDYFQIMPD